MKKNVIVFCLAGLLIGSGASLLSSCIKSSVNNFKSTGLVSVLQASPGAPGMAVFFNSTNLGTIYYGQSGVTQPAIGNYRISFVNPSTGDTLNQIQDSINMANYSLVLYDTTSPAKIMFFKDQYDQPQTPTDTYIRFLQLSPDAGAVNVYMDSTEVYNGRTFADNVTNSALSKFSIHTQGYHSFVVLSAANNDTLGKLTKVPLMGGTAYTVFLQGIAGSLSDSLGLGLHIMQNFQLFQPSSPIY